MLHWETLELHADPNFGYREERNKNIDNAITDCRGLLNESAANMPATPSARAKNPADEKFELQSSMRRARTIDDETLAKDDEIWMMDDNR